MVTDVACEDVNMWNYPADQHISMQMNKHWLRTEGQATQANSDPKVAISQPSKKNENALTKQLFFFY